MRPSPQSRDFDPSEIRTYTRGPDLSRSSLSAAGGTAGILALATGEPGSTTATYGYAYDGIRLWLRTKNPDAPAGQGGNVLGLFDNTGSFAVSYEYDPFGNVTVLSGDETLNPFRFSTQRYLPEANLHQYLFRFYDPEAGRWLSRDPIAERGGLNLYGFVGNEPVGRWDLLGLKSAAEACRSTKSCEENLFELGRWSVQAIDRYREILDPVWRFLAKNNHNVPKGSRFPWLDIEPGPRAYPYRDTTLRKIWTNHVKEWTRAVGHGLNCLEIIRKQYSRGECNCPIPPEVKTWLSERQSEFERQSGILPSLDFAAEISPEAGTAVISTAIGVHLLYKGMRGMRGGGGGGLYPLSFHRGY